MSFKLQATSYKYRVSSIQYRASHRWRILNQVQEDSLSGDRASSI